MFFVFFYEILLSHFEGLTSKLRLDVQNTRSDEKFGIHIVEIGPRLEAGKR